MKLLYKVMIFLAMFQVIVVSVESMNVFPISFFGENEIDTLQIEQTDDVPAAMETIFINMFVPSQSIFGTAAYGVAGLTLLFIGIGAIVSFATKQNPAILVIAVIGYSFFAMISNSFGFFSNLFRTWDSPSLIYIGVAIGVGLVIVTIITILETITHGSSGT